MADDIACSQVDLTLLAVGDIVALRIHTVASIFHKACLAVTHRHGFPEGRTFGAGSRFEGLTGLTL